MQFTFCISLSLEGRIFSPILRSLTTTAAAGIHKAAGEI